MTLPAVIIGALIGAAASVPFWNTQRLAKAKRRKGSDLNLGTLLAIVIATLIFLSLAILVCAVIARSVLLVFAIAEIVTFLVSTLAYAMRFFRQHG